MRRNLSFQSHYWSAFCLIINAVRITQCEADRLFKTRRKNFRRRSFDTEGVITHERLNDDGLSHTVTIRQSLFGECDDPNSNERARKMVVTWLDPSTQEPTCGFKETKVTACFERTVEIGCDPATNKATVDVYIKDGSFRPSWRYTVKNPLLEPNCRFGRSKFSSSVIQVTKTFDCGLDTSLSTTGPEGTCTDAYDFCMEGNHCFWMESEGAYRCKPYAAGGSSCGGFTVHGSPNICDPATAYCQSDPKQCMIPDASGTCVPFGGSCTNQSQCTTKEHCDESVGRCKRRLPELHCCDPSEKHCAKNLECRKNDPYVTDEDGFNLCRSPEINLALGTCSETHNSCGKNQYCRFSEANGYICDNYVDIDDSCGGASIPGGQKHCNPNEAFCYNEKECTLNNDQGVCVAFGYICKFDTDCSSTEWCDSLAQKCKPRISDGGCCDPNGKKNCADGLACAGNNTGPDGPYTCQPYADTVSTIGPDGTCSDEYDFCLNGTYCGWVESEDVYRCKPYAAGGSSCGGFIVYGSPNICDPATAYCQSDPEQCMIPDAPGTCVPFGGSCTNQSQCTTEEYCDEFVGRCKRRLPELHCCDPSEKHCAKNLECRKNDPDVTDEDGFDLCRSPEINLSSGTCSETHNSCGKNQYCRFSEANGYICENYVDIDDSCGGASIPGDQKRCNPNEAFCYNKKECTLNNDQGVCVFFGDICKADEDCSSNEWCDGFAQRCKPRISEGGCCEPSRKNNCANGLACAGNNNGPDGPNTCQPYADTGDKCQGFSPVTGYHRPCQPGTHFCRNDASCFGYTAGLCEELGNACTDDEDCADASKEWCNQVMGKCTNKVSKGGCCEGDRMCQEGTTCKTDLAMAANFGPLCLTP